MFTINEILKAVNGKLLSQGKTTDIDSISIDSRNIVRASLFIPIVGKRLNGHKFIRSAFDNGAVATLTSAMIKPIKNQSVIFVKDTEKALHKIAKAYKERYKIPFVGITGSSGKTTTKDMLASILSLKGHTLKTEENYNNEIGVPLTLLKLKDKYKFCVIEMAMQAVGEIEELAEIVRPNISIITNIGEAHIGLLNSKVNIAKTKCEILKFNKKSDTAVLPYDDSYFSYLKSRTKCRPLSYGLDSKADIRAINITIKNKGISFDLIHKKKMLRIDLPVPGIHNIYNALAAAAAAFALNIAPAMIKKGLEKTKLSSKRMEIAQYNGIRIINDSYNANPSSMKASLETLKYQLPVINNEPPRRIAVLGDMLELGKYSKPSHIKIGNFVADIGIEILFTVGKLGRLIGKGAKQAGMKDVSISASNIETLKKLKSIIKQNDIVLIKGSRSMRMEEIAEGLTK